MSKDKLNIRERMAKHSLFYQQVWQACAEIPCGQTRSYRWVAEKIGRPKAYRAVGQALKRNPFAPIIPCHRVISKDGSLGGYSLGTEKKQQLLEREKSWGVK
ncbi:MAG: MGMT family protein [Elusimicrobiota bacterium]